MEFKHDLNAAFCKHVLKPKYKNTGKSHSVQRFFYAFFGEDLWSNSIAEGH